MFLIMILNEGIIIVKNVSGTFTKQNSKFIT